MFKYENGAYRDLIFNQLDNLIPIIVFNCDLNSWVLLCFCSFMISCDSAKDLTTKHCCFVIFELDCFFLLLCLFAEKG